MQVQFFKYVIFRIFTNPELLVLFFIKKIITNLYKHAF